LRPAPQAKREISPRKPRSRRNRTTTRPDAVPAAVMPVRWATAIREIFRRVCAREAAFPAEAAPREYAQRCGEPMWGCEVRRPYAVFSVILGGALTSIIASGTLLNGRAALPLSPSAHRSATISRRALNSKLLAEAVALIGESSTSAHGVSPPLVGRAGVRMAPEIDLQVGDSIVPRPECGGDSKRSPRRLQFRRNPGVARCPKGEPLWARMAVNPLY
jgi:hypothetical protein